MNKKSQMGTISVMAILIVLVVIYLVGLSYVQITNNLQFDREIGGYFKLSYQASDINKKVNYFDKGLEALNKNALDGYAVWFFTKPNNHVPELYSVAQSLSDRMHNLLAMNKSSFEYQTGMQQVEEEIAYFIGEDKDDNSFQSNVLGLFERAYCFKYHMAMFCV